MGDFVPRVERGGNSRVQPSNLGKDRASRRCRGYQLVFCLGQNQKMAFDSATLHDNWNRLGLEFTRLWDDMYSDTAVVTLKELEERAASFSKQALTLPDNKRSMLRWQDYIERHHHVHA